MPKPKEYHQVITATAEEEIKEGDQVVVNDWVRGTALYDVEEGEVITIGLELSAKITERKAKTRGS